jgi:hypothetical protein
MLGSLGRRTFGSQTLLYPGCKSIRVEKAVFADGDPRTDVTLLNLACDHGSRSLPQSPARPRSVPDVFKTRSELGNTKRRREPFSRAR